MAVSTRSSRAHTRDDESATGEIGPRRTTITVHSSRKSVELSSEDDAMVRRTSLLLSSPAGPETVLTRTEIQRLQRFGSKYLNLSRMSSTRRRRDGTRLSGSSLDSTSRVASKYSVTTPTSVKEGHDDDVVDETPAVRVKPARPLPPWMLALRRRLQSAVKADWFRALLFLVVIADILVLALDNEYTTTSVLAQLDLAFTLLLLLEVVLKVAAFGLWGSPEAYFQRSKYRFLQITLLALSLLSHGLSGTASSQWKVLRGLKTIRSLTLYSGLRRILKALVRAVPFLANVGTLSLFGLLAFSIFGLEAYSGTYDTQCTVVLVHDDQDVPMVLSDADLASSAASSLASVVMEALPRVYCGSNASCDANAQMCHEMTPPSQHVNFDSGLSSLFLVFLVVAQDGWVIDIMKPVIEASTGFSVLFFVAIVASMVFLVVNLFVAVITTAFMNFTLDGESGGEQPHFMGKMDPEMEETQVNMIMGATLVIEDSKLKDGDGAEVPGVLDPPLETEEAPGTESALAVASDSAPPNESASEGGITTPKRLARPASSPYNTADLNRKEGYLNVLAQMHKWRTLRNLTVETTMQLLQNEALMDELMMPLTRSHQVKSENSNSLVGASATERLTTVPSNSPEGIARPTLTASRRMASKLDPITSMGELHYSASTFALVMENSADTNPLFVRFQRFVLSKKFDDFVTVCIVVNTLCLLVEYPNMSQELTMALSVSEYFFGVLFFLEMVMRIVAMRGLRRYVQSTERVFDMVVVACTTGNLVLTNMEASFNGLNSVSSLRTLRVTRLMMKYEGTRKLIQSVLKSSRGVMDVVIFMLLFQIVNSIIGMQLFGGTHLSGSDGVVPRWNFDTFGRSFLTLLQVITGDQWSSIAYDAVDASDPHWLMVPFLIINFIVGQYVLLNLFIAVILENFSISEEEAYQLQLAQIIAIPKELDIYEKIEEVGVRAFGEMDQLENVSNVKLRMFLGLDDRRADGGNQSTRDSSPEQNDSEGRHGTGATGQRHGVLMTRAVSFQTRNNHRLSTHRISAWKRGCHQVAESVWFSRLVQFMILVSCICLILDDPHPQMSPNPPSETFELALTTLSRIALVVLIAEAIVKVGAYGFGLEYLRVTIFHSDEMLGYVHRQTYMEDKWNQLDLGLLVLAVADEIITVIDPTMSAASVFRAGRVLRPLRMLNHNSEMKVILNAVARSLPHVGNVLALCFIVYIIFGVVGRSLFAGKFYSCNDSSVTSAAECVGFFTIFPTGVQALQEASARGVPGGAILVPRVWQNARFSFDNIGSGFLTLLEMTSLKWVDKTFAAMDIAGTDKQPQTDASAEFAFFFVLYVYVGSLFVIRLFVGVLVEQFQRNNGTEILTENQKSWVDLEKFILLLKPLKRIPRPRIQLQARIYDLCQHPYFSTAVSVAIMLNIVLLLVSPRDQGNDSLSFKVIEIIFLAVFTTEALLKCVGMRHYYVLKPQGAFELLILTGSLIAYFFAKEYHTVIQAGRVFRMMRVLRFVHLNRGVYTVFQTFRASLRPLGQIFFLMFMIYFIFAVVARQLFGGVRFGSAMNNFSNFRSFGSATLLLFQIMSGDDWHLTMTDCMAQKPFCSERTDESSGLVYSDCGSTAGAAFFFVTYVTLVVFVFLNLFIAVILENFRSCYLKSDVCAVSLLDFEAYREVFQRFDVNNTGTFPLWQLKRFLDELPPGLRIKAHLQRTAFLQIRSQAQAQTTSGACKRPFFNELLRILCIQQMGIRSLPYEQQRDRVKQIFIYRAKVAQMLVESLVKGYIQRWRMRKARSIARLAAGTTNTMPSARVGSRSSVRFACDEGGTNKPNAELQVAKALCKEVETQTDPEEAVEQSHRDREQAGEEGRGREHRHRRCHHRKHHRHHSKKRRREDVGQAPVAPDLFIVDQQPKEHAVLTASSESPGGSHELAVIEPTASEQQSSKARPGHLPPLVIKKTREATSRPPHSSKVVPSL